KKLNNSKTAKTTKNNEKQRKNKMDFNNDWMFDDASTSSDDSFGVNIDPKYEISIDEYEKYDEDDEVNENNKDLYDVINSANLEPEQLKKIINKVFGHTKENLDLKIKKVNGKIVKIKVISKRYFIEELKHKHILEINKFIIDNKDKLNDIQFSDDNNDKVNNENVINNTNENYIEKLPKEIIHEITKDFPLREIVSFCNTCKKFQNMLGVLCDENEIINKIETYVMLSNNKLNLDLIFEAYNNIMRRGKKVSEKIEELRESVMDRDELLKENLIKRLNFFIKVIKLKYGELTENQKNKIADKIYDRVFYYIFDYDEIDEEKFKYDYYRRKMLLEAGKIDLARFVIDEIRRIFNLSKKYYVKT
ncbi:MAG: hypothetical protein NZZ41_07910, partial [Candidatus Dojkabacteria bacterium]|nr:hypothetical protein [Candidatus Dojkabacteria bacterium]